MSIAQRETEVEANYEAAKEALCLRVADMALHDCLSKERLDEMRPVYDEVCGYAAKIISFASDVRKHDDETASYYPLAFEFAEITSEDLQADAALQRVLRKLSKTEESELPDVIDCGGQPVGISTWKINIGGVGMYVHRRRSLSEPDAPIYFSVENVSNAMIEQEES